MAFSRKDILFFGDMLDVYNDVTAVVKEVVADNTNSNCSTCLATDYWRYLVDKQ